MKKLEVLDRVSNQSFNIRIDYSFYKINDEYSAYLRVGQGEEQEGIIKNKSIPFLSAKNNFKMDAMHREPNGILNKIFLVKEEIDDPLIDDGFIQRKDLMEYVIYNPYTYLSSSENNNGLLAVIKPQSGIGLLLDSNKLIYPHSRIVVQDGVSSYYKRTILDFAISKMNNKYRLRELINHLISTENVLVQSTDSDNFDETNFFITYQMTRDFVEEKISHSEDKSLSSIQFLSLTEEYFNSKLMASKFKKSNHKIKLIVAKDEEDGIGLNGGLPWKIPEELKFFKEQTMNNTLLVGRTTYETLPPLKGRKILVMTSNTENKKDYEVNSIEEALMKTEGDLFIAGGKATYETLSHHADEYIVTEIHECFDSDTKLLLNLNNMKLTYEKECKAIERNTGNKVSYTISHYLREHK